MTKREFKYIINIVILLLAVITYSAMRLTPFHRIRPSAPGGSYYVTRAIDGDTLKLSNGERVRLIGIDTPESRYNNKLERDVTRSSKDMNTILKMGKLAAAFTKNLVEEKTVRLEFDVEKHDKYGRLLAYVYLEDGTFVNAKIVEEGYAQIMTIPPNVKYTGYFSKLQKEAREKNKGLWENGAGKSLF